MSFSKALLLPLALWIFWSAPNFASAQEERIVGYVPMGADSKRLESGEVFNKLTHLNLAFENPIDDKGQFGPLKRLKPWVEIAKRHKIKVLISIGGGSASENKEMQERYFRLIGSEKRDSFADGLLKLVRDNQLDGLDVDLEGPAINSDYGPFIESLSKRFKEHSLLLTSALSKGYGGQKVTDETLQKFDFVNVMAYDATGPWAPDRPGPHSSYEFAEENVRYWKQRGLSSDRVVLGVPFYGHGFGAQKGSHTYRSIVQKFPNSMRDDAAGNVIHYNGMDTIKKKTELARREKLGGIMIWAISQDTMDDNSLLTVIHSGLQR